jgi:hypothetical protein
MAHLRVDLVSIAPGLIDTDMQQNMRMLFAAY